MAVAVVPPLAAQPMVVMPGFERMIVGQYLHHRDQAAIEERPMPAPRLTPVIALELARGGRRRGGARAPPRRDRPGRGNPSRHRRRSIHVSPASETRTSKRLRPGPSWRSGVIQTMRASTRRAPRARGVFSGIRPMASSAIRNQTWSPSGPSSAPNQKVPFGSRVGSRAVRVLAPPGSPRAPGHSGWPAPRPAGRR